MKSFASSLAAVIALAGPAVAFPALTPEMASNLARRQAVAPQGAGFLPLAPPPFDAAAQYISTSGQYAFVAPGPGDARGECPGLNAMANHGYLPHNGFATIQQFIDSTNKVFGMARDLGGFLAFYGAIVDGPGFGWSLEGGPHIGIGGSHGNYEADSSPMKSDLNQYGSNVRLILEQFHELYDMQPDAATANYNLEVLRTFRGIRFYESINKNPYFTYNPFAGIEVSQAAFTFIYRFMANKSAEYPEGILNKNVLKSFMAISGPENNLTWTKGYERIPNNWYKRNPADEYSIPYFEADILSFAATQPEILDVGCNMGTVNSYNSISPQQLSNGAYDAKAVAANPFCYGLAFAQAQGAAQLGLSSSQTSALSGLLGPLMTANNCTSFKNGGNATALLVCPGASLYGGPTGYVAPGAIQNN